MKKIMMLLLAAWLLAGCSSSELLYSWKAEKQATVKFSKVMVVGLMLDSDISLREQMENHFVGDLASKGYTAVSSLKELGPASFKGMTEQQALDAIRNSGADAVITIVLLDKEREKYYVPGRVYYSPYVVYHRRFWGYYSTMYNRIYEPGYYSVRTNLFWESNFYDLKNMQLLYSAQTKSFDPSSSSSMAHEYGKMIVKDMFTKGVIQ